MRIILKTTITQIACLFIGLFFVACDDETGEIGKQVMSNSDKVSISQDAFSVITKSIKVDSVLANTKECLLGRILDPETQAITTSDFIAQFHVMENYQLPNEDKMVKDNNGLITADSADVRIYFTSYYGDSLNVMKIGLYELDKNNVIEENQDLYTNLSPQEYVSNDPNSLKTSTSFAIKDLTIEDSTRNLYTYYKNIRIPLSKDYGTFILRSYYENKENFVDSYHFIHNIVPGFYIKLLGGIGTMVNVDVSTLNIYFSYHYTTSDNVDSISVGVARMAATEEVIQNTHVKNTNMENLITAKDYTFLKSPSGIFTEATIPVDSAYSDNHYGQTINSAQLIFSRYNNIELSNYNLTSPPTIMMVRKSNLYSFFEDNEIPDGRTSYIATYTSAYNSYIFSNLSNLFEDLRDERDEGANITSDDSKETRNAKYKEWEDANPDWNKIVLLPVTVDYNTSNVITRVKNDLSLHSTRLVSGYTNENSPKVDIIYSSFEN